MGSKLIFIFLDGIGLGPDTVSNPFTKASMPILSKYIGEPLIKTTDVREKDLLVKGIDACLGVEGIPQSATGQTSLFTGFNAQAILGHHLMAYPNQQLISLINKRSIFKYAGENGITSTFANSYTDGFFQTKDQGSTSWSVTTRCVLATPDMKFNTIDDLIDNKAVHWDIINSTLQNLHGNRAAVITPFKAGQNLQHLTKEYDLVLFECFLPDLIGHRKNMTNAISYLEMFDEFLEGVLSDKSEEIQILISSDHGNMEDLSFGGHNRNHVPLLFFGNLAPLFSDVNSIDGLFDALFLNVFNTKPIAEY